jgi:hypothetical protein
MHEFLKTSGRLQKSLFDPVILLTNDIYDSYSKLTHQNNGELRGVLLDLLDTIEKYLKLNINTLSMRTLSNAAYYYCKFQRGTGDFWKLLEVNLLKSKDSMTISQLSKSLLAIVMNNRPIDLKLSEELISSI